MSHAPRDVQQVKGSKKKKAQTKDPSADRTTTEEDGIPAPTVLEKPKTKKKKHRKKKTKQDQASEEKHTTNGCGDEDHHHEEEDEEKQDDVWSTHLAPDGRTYYYNQESKKSQWTKPLMDVQKDHRSLHDRFNRSREGRWEKFQVLRDDPFHDATTATSSSNEAHGGGGGGGGVIVKATTAHEEPYAKPLDKEQLLERQSHHDHQQLVLHQLTQQMSHFYADMKELVQNQQHDHQEREKMIQQQMSVTSSLIESFEKLMADHQATTKNHHHQLSVSSSTEASALSVGLTKDKPLKPSQSKNTDIVVISPEPPLDDHLPMCRDCGGFGIQLVCPETGYCAHCTRTRKSKDPKKDVTSARSSQVFQEQHIDWDTSSSDSCIDEDDDQDWDSSD